jgi:hypothetical protein
MAAFEKAAVRYETPTWRTSLAVVTANTIGHSGPVGTARI